MDRARWERRRLEKKLSAERRQQDRQERSPAEQLRIIEARRRHGLGNSGRETARLLATDAARSGTGRAFFESQLSGISAAFRPRLFRRFVKAAAAAFLAADLPVERLILLPGSAAATVDAFLSSDQKKPEPLGSVSLEAILSQPEQAAQQLFQGLRKAAAQEVSCGR